MDPRCEAARVHLDAAQRAEARAIANELAALARAARSCPAPSPNVTPAAGAPTAPATPIPPSDTARISSGLAKWPTRQWAGGSRSTSATTTKPGWTTTAAPMSCWPGSRPSASAPSKPTPADAPSLSAPSGCGQDVVRRRLKRGRGLINPASLQLRTSVKT